MQFTNYRSHARRSCAGAPHSPVYSHECDLTVLLLQILALFESSCHPEYSPERASCALQFLDRIIQVLSLCTIDAHNLDASTFSPRTVPVVYAPDTYRSSKKCTCLTILHSPVAAQLDDHTACFSFTAPWDPSCSDSEIRKEECRRLCWSALALISSYTLQCSAFHQEPQSFALSDPANVRHVLHDTISVTDAATVCFALPWRGVRACPQSSPAVRAHPQGVAMGALLPQYAPMEQLRPLSR